MSLAVLADGVCIHPPCIMSCKQMNSELKTEQWQFFFFLIAFPPLSLQFFPVVVDNHNGVCALFAFVLSHFLRRDQPEERGEASAPPSLLPMT